MKRDELDGPLLRVRTGVMTQRLDRTTGEWVDSQLGPESEWTVIKRGNVVDVTITQPVIDVADIPLRVFIRRALQALKQIL